MMKNVDENHRLASDFQIISTPEQQLDYGLAKPISISQKLF
jgi:hypothetical protein